MRDDQGDTPPLSPTIYRRRRIAAVVAAIVVIALLWWVLRSVGDSNDDSSEQAVESLSTSNSPNMTGEPEPPNQKAKKTDDPAEEKTGESEPSDDNADPNAEKASCELADLRVTAVPGSSTFAADAQPNFFAKIHNPTKGDCDLDVDKDKLSFEVFALNDYHRVWGDLDCNEASLDGTVTIEAGKSKNYELGEWSRTTSAPEKCENRQRVPAGSYLLYAHLGGNVSEPATFNLR